jgi:sugar phosphate isomerase/epimerase
MPKLSMNQMTTYRWSLLEDVTQYREHGFEGIGVWRRKVADFGEERSLELLRDSELPVSNLLWGGGFTGADGRSFRESIDDAREGIRLARALDTNTLVIISGARGGHTNNHAKSLLVDALKELVPTAADEGVSLALEPFDRMFSKDWSFLFSVDDALEIVDRVAAPEMGLALDVYHVWQDDGLLDRIPELAPLIRVVHLADWREPPRSENDRVQLGEGVIPLADFVRALDASGFDGYYDVEILSDELWQADYNDLIAESRRAFERIRS